MLQRITDLTKEELLALEGEDVQRFVEIEAAYEGIVPIPDPGQPPAAPKIEKTIQAYQVGNLIFLDQGEAGRVAAMSSLRKTEYDYSGAGYGYQWLEVGENTGVQTIWFFARDQVKALAKELTLYAKIKTAYEKLADQHSKYCKRLEGIGERVWAPVIEAREENYRINQARAVYANHLKLAEGDAKIAGNFFRKAYQDEPEIIMAVLCEVQPEPQAEAVPA